jgi:hypothetical protein
MKTRYPYLTTAALALGLSNGAMAADPPGTESTPISNQNITPYIIDGKNPGGNRTCGEVGNAYFGRADYYQCYSEKRDYPGGFDHAAFDDSSTNDDCARNNITVDVTEDTEVEFEALTDGILISKELQPRRESTIRGAGRTLPPPPTGGSAKRGDRSGG